MKISNQVLEWVNKSIDSQATIQSVSRLIGGISSIVYSISLETTSGVIEVVLRQFDNLNWLKEEPDLALHEAESLRQAAKTNLPTPKIIAYDVTGEQCGVPAVLMTKLEGKVQLQPDHMSDWIEGLAKTLSQIHHTEASNSNWNYYTYNDINSLQTPTWSSYPEKWNQVFEIVKGPRPDYKERFIHRDYHPCNVLWKDNKVSGVVDWVNSCKGPVGVDIGHCRWNLAMLYDVEVADAFLEEYEKHAGPNFTYNPYWDLLSLIDVLFGPPVVYQGWTALGMTGLTDELMVERMDRYMISLLRRM